MPRPLILLFAVLAAGIAAGLAGAAAIVGWTAAQAEGFGDPVSAFLVFGVILGLYGLCAAVVLGLPTHMLLVRSRRTGSLAYVLTGAVAGALIGGLFALGARDGAVLLLVGLVAGAAGGSTFHAVARPDRLRRA
jgi:hypothetical protein